MRKGEQLIGYTWLISLLKNYFEIKTEILFCQPTAWLPIFAQFTSHLHTSRFKIHEITYHLVCLREPDLQEKLNQVETIPYKECDKILGSDWLTQEQRGWLLEMIGLLLRVGLRTRPGEVDEEQETLCLLKEVLGSRSLWIWTNVRCSLLSVVKS